MKKNLLVLILMLFSSLSFAQITYTDNIDTIADCIGKPPVTNWSIKQTFKSKNEDVHTYVTPVVGDLDGDGIPEIVVRNQSRINIDFLTYADWGTDKIYIYWGNNRNNPTSFFTEESPPNPLLIAKVKIGNIYKNIIVSVALDGYLYAYEPSGILLWKSDFQVYLNIFTNVNCNPVNATDFGGDGQVELYIEKYICDAATGKLLVEIPDGGNCGRNYISSGSSRNTSSFMPVAADVTGDGLPEYCAGTEVYSINITNRNGTAGNSATLIKSIPDVDMGNGYFMKDGKTSVADIDRDGYLDIVFTSSLTLDRFGIIAWSPHTETLIAKTTSNTNCGYSGYQFIGNIDNEPNLEIVITSANCDFNVNCGGNACYNLEEAGKVEAFRWDGNNSFNMVYKKLTSDWSGMTGITLFDFNNDGVPELVYRDMTNIRVMQASPTTNSFVDIFTSPINAGTGWEYSIVADVDNDRQAEIITVGGWEERAQYGNLYIYKTNGSAWAPARKVWNQYAYNSVNVNENLTIPQYYFNPATWFAGADQILGTSDDIQPFNNFLQQQNFLNRYGNPLWLLETPRDTITKTICKGEVFEFKNQYLIQEGHYYDTVVVENGCDTLVTLILKVDNCNPYAKICPDKGSFEVFCPPLTGRDIDCVDMTFDNSAKNEGFVDIVCQEPNSISFISVDIPDFVRPNNYSAIVTIHYSDNSQVDVSIDFTILYSASIIEQLWNDVLALKNDRYNGGYKFSAYEWYLNDEKIPNEKQSFIYMKNGGILSMGQEYRALLTRADDGVKMLTCPFIPTLHTDITTFPTIVGSNSQFHIISKNATKVKIFTVTGIKVAEYRINTGDAAVITAPNVAGVYILVLEDVNGKIQSEKIIVK